ncbi:hypothetical protein Ddye_021947 [Dipteronia dyeriana]|uniref:Uncharacterized protein n=1 Tax=Dipteronia dyeriana TaxID=168575 RepID=A0AAD9U350_9ROSI|nr:hypothetical protein Ddye_021947 [Dipteronia dyeriana]
MAETEVGENRESYHKFEIRDSRSFALLVVKIGHGIKLDTRSQDAPQRNPGSFTSGVTECYGEKIQQSLNPEGGSGPSQASEMCIDGPGIGIEGSSTELGLQVI